MLTKKKYSGELSHLVSSIQKAFDRNQESLIFKKSTSYQSYLLKFIELGLIKSYYETTDILIIKLKQRNIINKTPAIIHLQVYKKNHPLTIINQNILKQNIIRNGTVSNTLLHTDKGLLLGIDAIRLHLGGKKILTIV